MQSTQQGMSETSKELRKVQIEMRDTDGVFKQLREQSDATQRELDKQKHHSKTVSEQVMYKIISVQVKWMKKSKLVGTKGCKCLGSQIAHIIFVEQEGKFRISNICYRS